MTLTPEQIRIARSVALPGRDTVAEIIAATLDELKAKTIKHTLFGMMFDAERTGLLKRTASLCGVTVERVKEVCDG